MSRPKTPTRPKRRVIWWRLALVTVLAIVIVGVLAVAGLLFYEARSLPSVADFTKTPAMSSRIYDRNGHYITSIGLHNSLPITMRQVPHDFLRALIDTEDRTFYSNWGISLRGIARSLMVDVLHHSFVEGASTITQQVARDRYLTDTKSISRKIKEALLALELTRDYTKNEIMTVYLNEVYMGNGAYGLGQAARVYFGVSAKRLDLAQAAMLAGLPQAPSYYDPYYNFKAAKDRQRVVLGNMVAAGDITQKQADAAYAEPLHLQSNLGSGSYPDPWFVEAVINTLQGRIPLQTILNGGLNIYTTLDPKIEAIAVQSVQSVMQNAFPSSAETPEPEAAAVVMDPRSGDVLAIVGGRTHPVAFALDRAFVNRQTGSSIKPLAEYPAALEQGLTEATVIDDGPFMKVGGKFWPNNDTLEYYGRITMRHSLAISDNNNSVHLLSMVGVPAGFDMATKRFGLPLVRYGDANDFNLAMAIGGLTKGVTPLQMADAYATYANEGLRPTPIIVRKVVAPSGEVLYSRKPHLMYELSPQISYIMINMMEAVFSEPGATAYGASIGRPVAGKTGTSNQGRDGWFLGFTPQLVTAVWEGYDNEQPQPNTYGATYALPIWEKIMSQASLGLPVENFPRPGGIVSLKVDSKSGLLPSPLTPAQYINSYLFIQGTQPTQISNVWTQQAVDALHPKLLWSPACQPDPPLSKVFLTVPTDIQIGPNIPKPLDSYLWVPTNYCSPTPGGGNGSGKGSGKGSGNGGGTGSGNGGGTGGGTGGGSPGTGQESLSLAIQQNQFSTSQLAATVGTAFTLNVQNLDTTPHEFQLQTFMANPEVIPPGGSISLSFTPTQPGNFTYSLIDQPTATGTLQVSAPTQPTTSPTSPTGTGTTTTSPTGPAPSSPTP